MSFDMVYGSGLRRDLVLPPGSAYPAIPNGASLPSYATFNCRSDTSSAIAASMRASMSRNLFDKVYEIRDGTGVGVGAPSFGPRRGVFVGVAKTI